MDVVWIFYDIFKIIFMYKERHRPFVQEVKLSPSAVRPFMLSLLLIFLSFFLFCFFLSVFLSFFFLSFFFYIFIHLLAFIFLSFAWNSSLLCFLLIVFFYTSK